MCVLSSVTMAHNYAIHELPLNTGAYKRKCTLLFYNNNKIISQWRLGDIMLLSHSGEYPCECKQIDIRGKFAKNDTIGQEND